MSRRTRKNRLRRARLRARREESYRTRFSNQVLLSALAKAIMDMAGPSIVAFIEQDPVWSDSVSVLLRTVEGKDGLKDIWWRKEFYRNLRGYRLRAMIERLINV